MNMPVSTQLIKFAIQDRVSVMRAYPSQVFCRKAPEKVLWSSVEKQEFGLIRKIDEAGLITVEWENDSEENLFTVEDITRQEFSPESVMNFIREAGMMERSKQQILELLRRGFQQKADEKAQKLEEAEQDLRLQQKLQEALAQEEAQARAKARFEALSPEEQKQVLKQEQLAQRRQIQAKRSQIYMVPVAVPQTKKSSEDENEKQADEEFPDLIQQVEPQQDTANPDQQEHQGPAFVQEEEEDLNLDDSWGGSDDGEGWGEDGEDFDNDLNGQDALGVAL